MSTKPAGLKVPTPSRKLSPEDLAGHIPKSDQSWTHLDTLAASSAEQKARQLNGMSSPFEFGFTVEAHDTLLGEFQSLLWARRL